MDFAAARANMIESQVRTNDVSDLALQTAMRSVPREDFIIPSKRAFAYAEVTCASPSGRHLWKPRDFSKMAQAAKVLPGDKVLVIGGAAGYSAAVLATLGCDVTILDDVAAASVPSVTTIAGDLTQPPAGPFDIVWIDGGVETVHDGWKRVLANSGRLCVVVLSGHMGTAQIMTKSGETVASRVVFDAIVPKLPGFDAVSAFAF
jgi:protein-L-isoaspartate(D-aspartate) O-methyltransferase